MQNTDDGNGIMGGFSISNLTGPTLWVGILVAGAFVYLGGVFWLFREVAQF